MQAAGATIHYVAADDDIPYIEAVLRDNDGNAIDLAALDTVFFKMHQYPAPIDQPNPSIGGPAVIVDHAALAGTTNFGRVRYIWQSGDLVAGSYQCQWRVHFVGGSDAHYPNSRFDLVIVSATIGDAV